MPNVLRLIRKSDKRSFEGRDLIEIDEDMCAVLGVEPDPINWYGQWLDVIGFSLACGRTYAECRERYTDTIDVAILDYLETYYDPDCYYCR